MAIALIAVSVGTALGLWTPDALFHLNAEEFRVPWAEVLPSLLALSAGFSAAAAAALWALRRAIGPAAAAAWGAAFAVGLFLQGQFLLWDFGPLSGSGRAPLLHPGVLVDACVWGLLAASAWRRRDWWARHAAGAAALTLVGFGASYLLHSGPEPPAPGPAFKLEDVRRFGPSGNKLLVVLDAAQSDLFAQLLAEDGPGIARGLPGFVYFKDALASYPQTLAAVPALLSGKAYRQQMTLRAFIGEALAGGPLVSGLAKGGYEVQMVVPAPVLCDARSDVCGTVESVLLDRAEQVRDAVVHLLDLSLHRLSPAPLKVLQREAEVWPVRDLFGGGAAPWFHETHARLLREMGAGLSLGGSRPVFKYLHLQLTHGPPRLDAACRRAEGSPRDRKALKAQLRCALDLLGGFIGALRGAGVYAGTEIVVAADHGIGLAPFGGEEGEGRAGAPAYLRGLAYPLLLWKPAGRGEGFSVSDSPASLDDAAPTLCGPLCAADAFPRGAPLGAAGRRRVPRVFHELLIPEAAPGAAGVDLGGHVFSLDQSPSVRAWAVEGPAYRAQSWSRLADLPPARRLEVPARLDFSPSSRYEEFSAGWDSPVYDPGAGRHFSWAFGERVSVFLKAGDAPASYDVRITASTHENNPAQVVTILRRGRVLARFPVSTRPAAHGFSLAAASRGEEIDLDFRFSEWNAPPGGVDPRPLAARFWELEVSRKGE